MHARTLVQAGALVALVFASACASHSVAKISPPSEEVMMAKWTEFMTPSDGHKALANKSGRWKAEVTMWMPGAPEEKSTATCEAHWVMDGRYMEENFTGTFMGMPFQGRATTGYDNAQHKYVSTWIDNFGTGVMVSEGQYDPATKTFSTSGTGTCPLRGTDVPMRSVEKWIDNDHYVLEMYGPDYDGKEMKSMEMRFTRSM